MSSCIFEKSSCIKSKSPSTRSRTSTAPIFIFCSSSRKPVAVNVKRFEDFSMSRAMAGPCMRINPVMKLSKPISPSPSSRMVKISGSSSKSMSNNFIIRAKLTSSSTSSNSSLEMRPVPSASMSLNINRNCFTFFFSASTFRMAKASSSFLGNSTNAFLTTIAVMRLNNTMPVTPMWSMNKGNAIGILATIGRMMLAQLSKVIIWKSVNIASNNPPKCSWTTASLAKVSVLVTISITDTANMKFTTMMMTKAQNNK
mmetsp:Transcript_110296/g.285036  ORF Transcript_110296/g.285036 Transcript_110296/m.285036 type:complete len:256 (+) Transcript_110296:879-1646(+)